MTAPLTLRQLTVATSSRQMLVERRKLTPVQAIRRLGPIQAQWSPSPYIALWSRLEGFERTQLERALRRGAVVKATLMRTTLHMVTADDYPPLAGAWHESWRRRCVSRLRSAGLDEEHLTARLRDFLERPRPLDELRDQVDRLTGDAMSSRYAALELAHALVPMTHVPPGGFWRRHGQAERVAWPGTPAPVGEGTVRLVQQFLGAFGPAGRRDIARFSGLPLRQVDAALDGLRPLRQHATEDGDELLDLPGARLPDPRISLPPRFLPRWDQVVIAYDERARVLPPEIERAAAVPLTGETVFLLEGRVAGGWGSGRSGRRASLTLEAWRDTSATERAGLEHEAARLLRWMEADAETFEIRWNRAAG